MRVQLADTVITVTGWDASLDSVGAYTLKVRKSPEELKAERESRKASGRPVRVDRMRSERKSVLWKDPEDPSRCCFLPGLWPRVRALLDRRGYSYEVEDLRNMDIRPQLDTSRMEGIEFRQNQDLAVALIAVSDCGIIKTSTAFGKSFLIGVLCKCLPTLNIVVATSSSMVVSTLYEYLVKQIPGEVGYLYQKGNTTQGRRVVVTTLKSLPNLSPERVNLLLVDEVHDVGDNTYGQAVSRFCFARRFGFTASDVRNDGSRIVMEALFGPVILEMTYEEAAEAGMVTPMNYTMLHCPGGPEVCRKLSFSDQDILLKRYSYWCNSSRNAVIASFVRDLKQSYGGQILIMVATLEHAIQLHMRLPWFKVAYYGAFDPEDLAARFPRERYPNLDLKAYRQTTRDLDRIRGAFSKGTLRYVISTRVFRQGVNFPHLRVLIRADGDTSEVSGIQIPGRLARLDDNKPCAYLVDIDDTFCPWAQRRAERRKALYDRQQWKEISRKDLIDDIGRGAEVPVRDAAGAEGTQGAELCGPCTEDE